MASLSRNAFLAKYTDSIVGLYRAGQTNGIGSDDHRSLVQDIKDSIGFLNDQEQFSVNVKQLFYVTPGSPPATTSWDWENEFFNIGILVAGYSEITVSFANQVKGAQGTLFIKKTISGDVTLNVPTTEHVGGTVSATTVLLSGNDEKLFRVDFFITETSGFQIVSLQSVVFTKIIHTSASNVLAINGNKVYRSTDNGVTWATYFTSGETLISDFDISGSNGCMLTSTPIALSSPPQSTFKVFDTIDGGLNWTQRATVDYLNDTIKTIAYYGSSAYYMRHGLDGRIFFYYNGVLGSFSGGATESMRPQEQCVLSTDLWVLQTRVDINTSEVLKRNSEYGFTTYSLSPLSTLRLFSIDFATASLGICVGSDSAGDAAIVKSVDGGATWAVKSINLNVGVLRKVRAISATSFICIGDNGIGHSVDSGENWTYYASPTNSLSLSAWDSDDIIICDSTFNIYKGFGTSVGNIYEFHVSESDPFFNGGVTIRGGDNSISGKLVLKSDVDGGGYGITIKAPESAMAGDYQLTLPSDDGSAGQLLSTNGSGVLSFITLATLLTADVAVTSAEILSLFTSPKQLIAAPGVNKIIDLISIQVRYKHVTTAYTVSTSVFITYGTSGAETTATGAPINNAFNHTTQIMGQQQTWNDSVRVNTKVSLNAVTANPAVGDGTIRVFMVYRIIDVT